MSITPNVAIKERVFEADGLSGTYIFYLAEQLKPQTTYTVTITYGQETASEDFAPTSTKTWTFKTGTASSTTTDNDFKTEYYVSIIIIISLIVLIVALAVVYFKKNKNRRLS